MTFLLAVLLAVSGCKDSAPCGAVSEPGMIDIRESLGLPSTVGLCLGFSDFDADGNTDLLLTHYESETRRSAWIYPGQGKQGFASPFEVRPAEDGRLTCAIADFDNERYTFWLSKRDRESEPFEKSRRI